MTAVRWTEDQLQAHQQRLQGQAIASPPVARTAPQGKTAAAGVPEAPKARLQALGRLKDGSMNATEARYAALLDQEKDAGRVLWWAFEAVKLRLAPNTHLIVDFFVMYADGRLEAVDVKGAKAIVEDDARVKMKVAADKFPWPFRMVYPRKAKDGGGWDEELI